MRSRRRSGGALAGRRYRAQRRTTARSFGERGVHGFDLTFCAPKSVSLVRALRADDVVFKAIADAHTTALAEAMEYLAAHAGYTRVPQRAHR